MEKGPFKDHVSLCFVLMTHYFSGKEGHCLLNHQQNGSKLWFQTACRTWGDEGEQGERAFSRWFLRILAIRRTCSVCKKRLKTEPLYLMNSKLELQHFCSGAPVVPVVSCYCCCCYCGLSEVCGSRKTSSPRENHAGHCGFANESGCEK